MYRFLRGDITPLLEGMLFARERSKDSMPGGNHENRDNANGTEPDAETDAAADAWDDPPSDASDKETLSLQPEQGQRSSLGRLTKALVALVVFLVALILVTEVAHVLREMGLADNLREAFFGKPTPTAPETLEDWIEQAENGDTAAKREEAAKEILRRGPEAVVATLDATTELSDDAMLHSEPVACALAAQGPDVVAALTTALNSQKENVRVAATIVLGKLGPDAIEAVPSLTKAVSDENRWIRWYTADTLGSIGPGAAPAVAELIPLIEHNDRFTRRRVIAALARIGPAAKDAAAPLKRVIENNSDREVRKAATTALYQVNLEEIVAEAEKQADEELRQLMRQVREGDEYESVTATGTLDKMGPVSVTAIPTMAMALRRDNKWIRVAAIEFLGNKGNQSREVVPALEQLTQDKAPEVREAAKKALQQILGKWSD